MRILYKQDAMTPPARDPSNQEIVGRVNSKTIKLALFQLEPLANWAADRFLRREAYPIAEVKIKGKRHLFRLQPGDDFLLTYTSYGISGKVFRVTKIEETAPDSEDITINAIEAVEYLGEPAILPETTECYAESMV